MRLLLVLAILGCVLAPAHSEEREDLYNGDCFTDLHGGCISPVVQTICPKSCGLCSIITTPTTTSMTIPATTTTTTVTSIPTTASTVTTTLDHQQGLSHTLSACRDIFVGDCTADFTEGCESAFVQTMCPKTCNACHLSTAMTTRAPTTTTTTTTAFTNLAASTVTTTTASPWHQEHTPIISTTCRDFYSGDCLADLIGGCESDFVKSVCRKTCHVCQSGSTDAGQVIG